MDRPSAFHTLAPEDFPFTIKFVSLETSEVVHEIRCDGPGVIEVPSFGENKVNVEIYWPDGTVEK